jgi:hypothetical protein
VTPLIFIAVSAWIGYAQIKQNPKESLVVLGVLAVGGLAYYFLVPTPKKTEPLQPPPTLPTARLHDE